jgi:small subunit ribosomal protein S21
MYVIARPEEPFEELLRRFKRGVESAGIIREYRRRQRFVPAHERRREALRHARRRAAKRRD